jgi:hypothetical protein
MKVLGFLVEASRRVGAVQRPQLLPFSVSARNRERREIGRAMDQTRIESREIKNSITCFTNRLGPVYQGGTIKR